MRRRIIGALEQADRADDPKLREQLLTFVLVGAGPTGCELAGELAEHFRRVPKEYRHIDPRQARIILVEAGPRALATFSEKLSAGAVKKLRALGVDVRIGQAVEHVDAEGVVIAGERVQTRTVLWTAGVAASPAGHWLGVETDRPGRVVVGPDLTVAGYPEVFVVGDTAHIENDSKVLPGVAQVALQSGKHAGAHDPRARIAPTATGAVYLLRQGQHGHHLGDVRDHGERQTEGRWAVGQGGLGIHPRAVPRTG